MAGSGRAEWGRHWPLPLIGMLGITAAGAYSYASGVIIEPVIREFGWTRAQFSSAFTLQMLFGLLVMPIVGRLIDRIGPRRFALGGIIPFMVIFSLFATANGQLWNWWLLSMLLTIGSAVVSPAVWVSGIIRGFTVSRGLAIAVALAGMGVATAIWPIIFAFYVQTIGWRLTFPAVALTWGVFVLPLTYFFFRPPPLSAEAVTERKESLPPVWPLLCTPMFIGLLIAAGTFAFIQLGLIVHFVPILRAKGMGLSAAAGLAGFLGIFAVIGRIATGALLDVLPTRLVAICAFALVMPALALLLFGTGSMAEMIVVAAILGLSVGSEIDALTYIVSQRFEARLFGSVYSVLQSGIAVCSSLGPLIAGRVFDLDGSYTRFIWLCVPLDILAVTLIAVVLSRAPVVVSTEHPLARS